MSLFAESPSGEPMHLGSPASPAQAFTNHPLDLAKSGGALSPATPRTPAYAPSFLLGGPQESLSQSYAAQAETPARKLLPPRSAAAPGQRQVTWSPRLVEYEGAAVAASPSAAPGLAHTPRQHGPPLRSLNSMTSSGRYVTPASPVPQSPASLVGHPSFDESLAEESTRAANVTAAEVDPFFTQGLGLEPGRDLDPRVVTVFGFPPEAAEAVEAEFAALGTILRSERGRGNWLHLAYQSPMQAKTALSKQAKILCGGRVMVGVTACVDAKVVAAFRASLDATVSSGAAAPKARVDRGEAPPLWMSPRPPSIALRSSKAPATSTTPSADVGGPKAKLARAASLRERPRMRNLACATISPHSTLTPPAPSNTSLLNSTWNFIFGGGDRS